MDAGNQPAEAAVITRMLEVMQNDLLPLTDAGTTKGNKIFGAAIVAKEDLDLVIAGVNEEICNPLLHGEISCLNKYWALPAKQRPVPAECLFLSTHEPCSMCLSAITWSGFDNFYYLFSYENSRDNFQIPHDLKILDEVFNCPNGSYRKANQYWQSYNLVAMIDNSTSPQAAKWQQQVSALHQAYDKLSQRYQSTKADQNIPLD